MNGLVLPGHFVVLLLTHFVIHRPILKRYKTCTDPESVLAMQEVMIAEMEQEQAERS